MKAHENKFPTSPGCPVIEKELQRIEKVLDGNSVAEDIRYIIGYVWSLGATEKVFPSEHLNELSTKFINKHFQ